ncbi:MAG: gfo/Idh/MocA family oxidoreductase, partial [Acidobacteria bacterium]|nr:gfo/Idh/MocA family oxidoreductase [Acidobacteriota bacterium]
MDSVSIAIVGCGSFGQHMADLMARLACLKIAAVCDPDEEKSLPLARRLGVPAHASFRRCLEESRAVAVALFTPNHLHASMA